MEAYQHSLGYRSATERKHWYFTHKTALVKECARKTITAAQGAMKILDVGCGIGVVLGALNECGTAFGLDYDREALYYCKKRGLARLVAGDILSGIPTRSEEFDIVCALDVLEHLEDDESCVCEIHRVLRADGRFIFTVPACKALWSDHDRAAGHKRRYVKQELTEKVARLGFSIERCTHFNCLVFPFVFLFRKMSFIFRRDSPKIQGPISDFEFHVPWIFDRAVLPLSAKIERLMLRYFNLPYGVSLLCVCRKEARGHG